MSEYCYAYGNEMTQDVDQAQIYIIAAFDLLIEEMRDYMRLYDSIVGTFETDEHQALSEQMRMFVHENISEVFGEDKAFEPNDPEAEKQLIRDENTAQLGGQEKRLQQLLVLRMMFAKTNPESMEQEPVHEAYRIFKIQVMRCGADICEPEWLHIKSAIAKLSVYSRALESCDRLDEGWDKDRVFPFADVDF